MFGMGFMEILLIAIIAIIALGPDKLPKAMVEIARFIKKFKSGIEDAKSTLDNELNISEMKAEAQRYKAQIEEAKSSLELIKNDDLGLSDIMNEDITKDDKKENLDNAKTSKEKISLKEEKKKKKKKKIEKTKLKEDITEEQAINKFKVNFDEEEEEK